MQNTEEKLLEQVRDAIRLPCCCTMQCKHYSIRTKETYANWIKRGTSRV